MAWASAEKEESSLVASLRERERERGNSFFFSLSLSLPLSLSLSLSLAISERGFTGRRNMRCERNSLSLSLSLFLSFSLARAFFLRWEKEVSGGRKMRDVSAKNEIIFQFFGLRKSR